MAIYFPRSPSVPEEIFFEILKFVHPGAIWLFCRRVSGSWKHHVDENIERFYKFHVGTVKSERQRANEICASGETIGHLVQRLQADSLYVEIRWVHSDGDAIPHSSSLALRFKAIELSPPPSAETTDQGIQWDGNITFEMEVKDVMVYGNEFAVNRIEHFIFPGFVPSDRRDENPAAAPSDDLKLGTHTLQFDVYGVTYTVHQFSSIRGLAIDHITVPLRSLLVFRSPHIVSTDISGSGSQAKLQYLSPLFSTVEEERELLPENVLVRRQREENEKWEEGMKPLCEHCAINPLDRWCEMWRCEVCCWREGVCTAHLAQERGSLGKRRKLLRRLTKAIVQEDEFVGAVVQEEEPWGTGEGQESWGMDFRNLGGTTLLDGDDIMDTFGQERLWLSKGYDVSTPPIFAFDEYFNVTGDVSRDDLDMDPIVRTQSAALRTERQWSRGCINRPASCCF